jgi:hypothetical protein
MSINFLQGTRGGKISMMRVATMMVVTSIMGVWVAHNIVAMFVGCSFISMGQTEMMLVALTLGAKAAQLFGEVRGNGKDRGSHEDYSDNSHSPEGSQDDSHGDSREDSRDDDSRGRIRDRSHDHSYDPPTTNDIPVDKTQ